MSTSTRPFAGQLQQRLRVQLVDGDAAARRRIAAYLRSAGLDVHEAADTVGALVRMHECRPDVVVLDLAVGWSQRFTGHSYGEPSLGGVPLVLLSGGEVNLSQAVQDLGARAGLAKSTDLDVLVAVLIRVAGGAARQDLGTPRNQAGCCSTTAPRHRRPRRRAKSRLRASSRLARTP